MKKIILPFIFCLFCLPLFSVELVKSASPKNSSYVMYVTPYDFGGCTDKIVINTGKNIDAQDIKASDFSVDITVSRSDLTGSDMGIVKASRTVSSAFLSDSFGLPSIETSGKYITLKFDVSPDDPYASPFIDSLIVKVDPVYGYRIRNSKLNFSIDRRTAIVCPEAAKFRISTHKWTDPDENSLDEITMNYASYVPEDSRNKKIPLIVFFHGIGESGTNPYRPLLKIRGNALAGRKIQSHFADGAAVLMPQCPTGWLEITEKDPFGNRLWAVVDLEGTIYGAVSKVTDPIGNFFSKVFSAPKQEYTSYVETPNSYYSMAAKELIDRFIEENPQIDKERIYVGGCSAGGFMTVNMMIQYTDFFAAAFPICEAFPNDRINDKDIARLSKKPMWFTLSQDDQTIKPEKNTIPTVNRLENAGAENLHHVYYDHVVDTSGKFFKKVELPATEGGESASDVPQPVSETKNPEPYQYNGHDSWIYVLNDEVNDKGLNLFDWLSAQRNSN